MRRALILITCLALAAVSLASIAHAEEPSSPAPAPAEAPEAPEAPESSLLSEGCHSNYTCLYRLQNYNELFFYVDCAASGLSSGHAPGGWGTGTSATNRCGNKTMWLRWNGNTVACMNPGGNRPSPGYFNEVFIAASYGAFC